jgi:hypothetical protein
MQAGPWDFGWTHALTVIGFIITLVIAVFGFRTFDRWKREKLEERRIEVAIDALAAAYKAKFVFEIIRSPMAYSNEWADMDESWGSEEQRRVRGPYYAALNRIRQNKEFFEHVWDLQPKCMAIFGPEVEETFRLMHQARRNIEVAADMLMRDAIDNSYGRSEQTQNMYEQMRVDIWGHPVDNQVDRVGEMLSQCRDRMEALCRPIVAQGYKKA